MHAGRVKPEMRGEVISRATRVRPIHVLADGTAVGSAIAFVSNLIDWITRHGRGPVGLAEKARLTLLGTVVPTLAAMKTFVFSRWGPLSLVILVTFSVFRRTRRAGTTVACCGLAALSAYGAAVAGELSYALQPILGLLSLVLAPLAGALFSRTPRWTIEAMLVLTAGLALGVLASQQVFVVQSSVGHVLQPFPAFLCFSGLSVIAARIVLRFQKTRHGGFGLRFLRMSGLSAACFCAVFSVAYESYQLRPRVPSPATKFVLEGPAYDVHLIGDRPDVVWTNRDYTQVLQDAYGTTHRRYSLEQEQKDPGDVHKAERIWPSVDGFYVQFEPLVGFWSVAPGQSIPVQATQWQQFPDMGPETPQYEKETPETAAFVEDPLTRRFLAVTEWYSHYAIVDRASHAVKARGSFSNALWPWWSATVDPSARLAYVSTALEGGWLYEFDLDLLRVVRKAPNVFFYETAIDSKAGMLWGVRPLCGDLVGLDARTLEFRHRIPVESTVRDIELDQSTGDLYTCSFLSGNVYRVDRDVLRASQIGWCGRMCRNLFLDSRRKVLWVASVEGVCQIDLARSGIGPDTVRAVN